MSRRGINIYKRKDNRWEGRIQTEKSAEGRRRYRSVYGNSYKEVKIQMEALKEKISADGRTEQRTVGEAVNIWLEERSPYWKKTTYATYTHISHKYILPMLGEVRLGRMDDARMNQFLSNIRKEEKLSNCYQRSICSVILRAMRYMKKKHHCNVEIPENPLSPERRGEREIPKEDNIAVLEQYLAEQAWQGNETCLGILTALYTGLRIGEVCALTWADIDVGNALIHIRQNLQRVKAVDGLKNNTEILLQTPKTERSCRMIPIPPALLPLFKNHEQEPDHYLIKGKRKPWAEPRTLQYRFARILKVCGLEHFNFHMLRHAFATQCIAGGFDVKSLSEILGHSSVQVTLNLYVHSNMQRKRQLMEQLNSSFYSKSIHNF